MLKFWLALILGTIGVAAGITYLKLHRGAQTISYPPVAARNKQARVEFIQAQPDTDDLKVEVSANVVTFHAKQSKAGKEYQMSIKLKNVGEADLDLNLLSQSCTCSEVYVDDKRVTLTDHQKKVPPGQTATIRMNYIPNKDQIANEEGKKTRVRATFTHNDERFSDNLHFEIVTLVVIDK